MALKLTQLASKPQLIKITIDDADLVKKYGDDIEFWVYDRQPLDQFIKMATMKPENFGEIIELFNELILDETGNKVLQEDQMLPTDIMTVVINKMVTTLGK